MERRICLNRKAFWHNEHIHASPEDGYKGALTKEYCDNIMYHRTLLRSDEPDYEDQINEGKGSKERPSPFRPLNQGETRGEGGRGDTPQSIIHVTPLVYIFIYAYIVCIYINYKV